MTTSLEPPESQSGEVLAKATRENFPVAPFFLPPRMRDGLMAVYGFARLVDDAGDGDLPDPEGTARLLGVERPASVPAPAGESPIEPVVEHLSGERSTVRTATGAHHSTTEDASAAPAGSGAPTAPAAAATAAAPGGVSPAEAAHRLALMDALDAEVDRVFATALGVAGAKPPRHPLLAALVPVVRAHGLTAEPFRALIQANRVDQHTSRYQTFDDLLGYCELSANPVGLLVLQLAGLATPERVRWSDAVCSALQVIEHLQDVAEDRAAGRIYLPQQDMKRFAVREADLDEPRAGTHLRGLVMFEAERARALLDEGAPLTASVTGRLRVLLTGFAAGGYAQLDAIAAAGYDVLAVSPKAGKGALARRAAGGLWHASRPGAARQQKDQSTQRGRR